MIQIHQWTDAAIADFFADLEALIQKSPAPKPSLKLVDPIPDFVSKYLKGKGKGNGEYSKVARLPCTVECEKGHRLASRWLSRSIMKAQGTGTPFTQVPCPDCEKAHQTLRLQQVQDKWGVKLAAANLQNAAKIQEISRSEFLKIAELFNNDLDFYNNSYTVFGRFYQLKNLLKKEMLLLEIVERGLSLKFVPFKILPLSMAEHSKLFESWAIKHVEDIALEVCRGQFEMSLKYREEIELLIQDTSYYELSYSLYTAKKDTIFMWEEHKRKRDITFKHSLRKALQNLYDGTWPNISESAKRMSQREIPDHFWRLVRLKEHNLTTEQILSCDLGYLALEIDNVNFFGPEEDEASKDVTL
jgi:hypothetical protein